MAFHQRSISLPSRPLSKVEDELHSIEAYVSSPSKTTKMISDGLRRLGDTYSSIEETMCLPSNQVCSSQQRKLFDREMEYSLELLDLCNTMNEVFTELKSIIQDLQVSLRKGDDAVVQAKIQSYIRLVKKAKKHSKKTVKKVASDKEDSKMVKLLSNAREITTSLFESTLDLLSKQIAMPKFSLISKAFQKKNAVICNEEQLQVLECCIADLEAGAGLLFRRLVQTRVEDELHSIEACVSSPSKTIEMISDGLRRLGDIYSSIEEIMCLPSNQVCSSQQRKLFDREMECSLELLDLCNAMNEVFTELKSIIQDLQVSLRKGDDAVVQAKILSYIRLVKKAKKHSKKTVKKVASDMEDSKKVKLLSNARQITTSLFESTLDLLSKQIVLPKLSLISKAFQKKNSVICNEEQLQALECCIGDLEAGAVLLFRRLVQSRHKEAELATDMAFHQRSISLPSRPLSKVEDELHSIEACISSPSTTIEVVSDGLRRLGDIYSSIVEIMCLPSNQICSSQQRRLLDGEMECSLQLLDLCNSMSEVFTELKIIIQDLQVHLRKGDGAVVQAKIQSFIRLMKNAKKHSKKTVKKVVSDNDCRIVKLMSEAREITTSLFESILYLLSKQITMPKSSLIPKAFQKKNLVICNEEQLQALECCIGDLEAGAGLLFRRLIQTRVEEELCILDACISSPSTTLDTMCEGLRRLANIYSSIEEIMCLPSNQAFSSQRRKLLDGEMECSLELLDLCNVMHEDFTELKAIIQDMQVALRKGDDAAVQSKTQSYYRLLKKAKKHFKTAKKVTYEKEDCRMARLLREARDISTSMLASTLHLLSKQIEMPKQSLVSKAFNKKKVVICEEEQLQLCFAPNIVCKRKDSM
uniref:Uncharacterized protein n=1 Tax=Oryza nivara TaxID=4536 RepID=A0A0E0IFK5_ORYNI